MLDTVEAAGDRELLLQSMKDYKDLVVRRFTHPECATSNLHFAHLNCALQTKATGRASVTTAAEWAGEQAKEATVRDLQQVAGQATEATEQGLRQAARQATEATEQDLRQAGWRRGAKVRSAEDVLKEQEAAAEQKRQILQDIIDQRERLRARVGKPVSSEALQSAQSILDRYPENFRPPGMPATWQYFA